MRIDAELLNQACNPIRIGVGILASQAMIGMCRLASQIEILGHMDETAEQGNAVRSAGNSQQHPLATEPLSSKSRSQPDREFSADG